MVEPNDMVDEYDPMPVIKAIVIAGSKSDADDDDDSVLKRIVVGAFPGNQSQKNEQRPFAFLRSAGGPEPDTQDPEAQRRIDVTVFADSEVEANRISSRIHRHIRRRRKDLEHALDFELPVLERLGLRDPGDDRQLVLPSIFSAGGPLDILDDDVKLPGVFRSYYVIYAEDCD